MKKEDAKKRTTVTGQLRMLTLSAVFVVALLLGVVSVIFSLFQIMSDYKNYAETSTIHLRDALENGHEDWQYESETGILTVNGKELSVELFNRINDEDPNVYHTFFLDDTRVVTNIKNEKGEYVLGTQADPGIYAKVKSGQTYTKNNVKIIGKDYTVCYLPIYSNGAFFGMLFTGISQSAVNKVILQSVMNILLFGIIGMAVVTIIAQSVLKKVSKEVSERLNSEYADLERFSDEVRSIADRTDQEAGEISKAMENVATEAVNQADASQQAMAGTEEFSANIDVVDNEINESYSFIDTIKNCLSDSENSINQLNDSIDSNNRLVADISEDIRDGVESTQKAKKIVDSINEIAMHINILALNASVEASHAGIYGRGFAVVADEIKNLAGASTKSVNETTEIIEDIVSTMNKTSKSNVQLVEINKEQLARSEDVRKKMAALKENIEEIELKINNIKEKSGNLEVVKNELVEAVSSLSSASQENAAISQEVSASTETVGQDVADLTESLNSIADICASLKDMVDFFG
jgi:methyl-accepting chemotaxis protein